MIHLISLSNEWNKQKDKKNTKQNTKQNKNKGDNQINFQKLEFTLSEINCLKKFISFQLIDFVDN